MYSRSSVAMFEFPSSAKLRFVGRTNASLCSASSLSMSAIECMDEEAMNHRDLRWCQKVTSDEALLREKVPDLRIAGVSSQTLEIWEN